VSKDFFVEKRARTDYSRCALTLRVALRAINFADAKLSNRSFCLSAVRTTRFSAWGLGVSKDIFVKKRARTDYSRCALTPSGSPCGRSTSPDGEVVEPSFCLSAVRIFADRQFLTIGAVRV
jgi:hypothetical protein